MFDAFVWCPDCNGVDPEGCFGGEHERLGPFATRGEAEQAAEAFIDDGIWRFDVVESHDV